MPFIQSDGAKLYYEAAGTRHPRDGGMTRGAGGFISPPSAPAKQEQTPC